LSPAPTEPASGASPAPQYNPAWLFGILSVPYGTFNALITILMPFLLRQHGVSVDRISGVVAIAAIPNFWYFLWSPVVDVGPLRRTWVMLAAGTSALCGWVAIVWAGASLTQLTVLLLAGNVVSMLLSSSCGALLSTTLDPAMRGRASGWYNAGNLGGGALGAGAAIWLASFTPLPVLATAAAAMVFLPSLAALRIIEERMPRKSPGVLFRAMSVDVWKLLRAPATWVGLVFFLSPVGSAAVGNLISSLGPDYHASAAQVAWVSGIAGVVSALGCLLGGFLCDRMSRMTAYAVAGLLSAIFSGWMALGSATSFTYAGGYIGYSLTAGVAYAAFTALELEVLGKRTHAAGTAYSLLGSSGNFPITYMTWLDGAAYTRGGTRGLMGVDALANALGAVLLLLFARFAARKWLRREAEPVLSAAKD
jgi:PAT family beta-lactamase induction signal transducer AmpG